MKIWHIVALLLIVVLAGVGIVLMSMGMRGEAEPVVSEMAVGPDLDIKRGGSEEQENETLEEMLKAFAEVIYTYDTRERLFYEGAQSFMTDQGYQMLVPLSTGEKIQEEDRPAAVISSLRKVSFYYGLSDKSHMQVMMEADFSLSRSGNGKILQYTKLFLKETGTGWKIDGFETVDTIEQ